MKFITYNINGLRAACKKGWLDWLKNVNPDVIFLQEIKIDETQIINSWFEDLGYQAYFYPAEKKGYSGVGILTKKKPDQIIYGMEGENHQIYNKEGRFLRIDFGEISLASIYFPSGSSGEERQTVKMQFLKDFNIFINEMLKKRKHWIIGTDLNIAHTALDLKNAKANEKSSGFLPEERAWLDNFLNNGWVDSFRFLHPNLAHQYTWWTYRSKTARINNVGWRIDYILTTESLKEKLKKSEIMPEAKHSDHCPVSLEIDLEI